MNLFTEAWTTAIGRNDLSDYFDRAQYRTTTTHAKEKINK